MGANQPRRPAGTPSGGQWAPAAHDEADVEVLGEGLRGLKKWGDIEQLAKSLPRTSFPKLYHVGTMDPTQKNAAYESLEGDGLSVSLHPDEWREIAELGNSPTWALTKAGNQFLDFHSLSDDQRSQIRQWGIAEGWLEPAKLWEISYYDDECEDRRLFVFDNEDEARGELDEKQEWGPETEPQMIEKDGAVATAKLSERVAMKRIDPSLAEELTAVVFAEDIAGLDGVWWEDTYDPSGLSCPRGVISVATLPSFRVERADQAARSTSGLTPERLGIIADIAFDHEPDWDEVFETGQHNWCGLASQEVVDYLTSEGIAAEVVSGGFRGCAHTWVQLLDGTIVDPTIAQYIDRTDEHIVDDDEVLWFPDADDEYRVAVIEPGHTLHDDYEPA
jgi:hypothetical protein